MTARLLCVIVAGWGCFLVFSCVLGFVTFMLNFWFFGVGPAELAAVGSYAVGVGPDHGCSAAVL